MMFISIILSLMSGGELSALPPNQADAPSHLASSSSLSFGDSIFFDVVNSTYIYGPHSSQTIDCSTPIVRCISSDFFSIIVPRSCTANLKNGIHFQGVDIRNLGYALVRSERQPYKNLAILYDGENPSFLWGYDAKDGVVLLIDGSKKRLQISELIATAEKLSPKALGERLSSLEPKFISSNDYFLRCGQ
jgi:hypothetical protein